MKKPTISVIVPVYKVEKYLQACISSILSQSFTEFELILVDDGSPDSSGAICEKYACKDSRIKVLHTENGGVTAARKCGLDIAQGDYITFVDSDDTLPVTALEDLWNEIRNGEYDIVIGRFDRKMYPTASLSASKYQSLSVSGKIIHTAPWARLISVRLFDENTLDIPRTIVKGEDMLMNIRLAFKNRKPVRLLSKQVYNYILHPESCTKTFNRSIEYESFYHSYRNASIPTEFRSMFIYETIESRVKGIEDVYSHCKKNTWTDTDFFRQLMDDIKLSKYPLSKLKKFKLYTSNRFILRLLHILDKLLK